MIYLDSNATTPASAAVNRAILNALQNGWGNPSSGHSMGKIARNSVEAARRQIAEFVGASPNEIIFTSGGTESNNLAIQSAVSGHKGRHIVTSSIEHPSIDQPVLQLEKSGYAVTRVPVSKHGLVDLGVLRSVVRPGETALITVMWANNETAVIQPIAEIANIANRAQSSFHTDAVQAVGKLRIKFDGSGIHYLSISGHKVYGPKGVGVLVARAQGPNQVAPIKPMILGGGQERTFRSGTENVPGIVGIGAAAAECASCDMVCETKLRDRFELGLLRISANIQIIGSAAPRVGNTTLFRMPGRPAAVITHKLDTKGIQVSSGSACHSGKTSPSKVLIAMGFSPTEASEAVRVSLSRFTTLGEIDYVLNVLEEILLPRMTHYSVSDVAANYPLECNVCLAKFSRGGADIETHDFGSKGHSILGAAPRATEVNTLATASDHL